MYKHKGTIHWIIVIFVLHIKEGQVILTFTEVKNNNSVTFLLKQTFMLLLCVICVLRSSIKPLAPP